MPRFLPGRPRRVQRVDDDVRELTPAEIHDAVLRFAWQAILIFACVYAAGSLVKYCG